MCHSPRAQESSTNGEPKHGLCTSILIPSRPHWAQPATMPICSEKLLTYTALMPLSGSHVLSCIAPFEDKIEALSPVSAPQNCGSGKGMWRHRDLPATLRWSPLLSRNRPLKFDFASDSFSDLPPCPPTLVARVCIFGSHPEHAPAQGDQPEKKAPTMAQKSSTSDPVHFDFGQKTIQG